jgi:hypothetical protein
MGDDIVAEIFQMRDYINAIAQYLDPGDIWSAMRTCRAWLNHKDAGGINTHFDEFRGKMQHHAGIMTLWDLYLARQDFAGLRKIYPMIANVAQIAPLCLELFLRDDFEYQVRH